MVSFQTVKLCKTFVDLQILNRNVPGNWLAVVASSSNGQEPMIMHGTQQKQVWLAKRGSDIWYLYSEIRE